MNDGPSRPRYLLPSIVAGVVLFVLILWNPFADQEGLVRVVRESRLSLMNELERARPVAGRGFPGDSPRWLFPFQNPEISREVDGLGVYVPPNGSFHWPQLPIHRGATLELRVAVDPFSGVPEGLIDNWSYTFTVDAVSGDATTTLLEHELGTSRELGALSEALSVSLEAYVGKRIDLVFSTRLNSTGGGASALPPLMPRWVDPVIVSEGTRVRVDDLSFDVTRPLVDFIVRAKDGSAFGKDAPKFESLLVSRSTRDSEVADRHKEALSTEPSFDTGPIKSVPAGGAQPAFVFAQSGELSFPLEDIQGGTRLMLSFGLRGYATPEALAVNSATLSVVVDGEVIGSHTLEAGHQGWVPLEFPIEEGAEQITWRVELGPSEPKSFVVPGTSTPGQEEEPPATFHEILICEAALGRPRLVVDRKVEPRLSGEGRPNIILIVAETLRADHLGCYNPDVTSTPNLDAMASRGVRYENVVSASSWTWPSTASILTGLYPESHGVRSERQSFLADQNTSLAEAVQDLGLVTSAFVTNGLVSREKNFDQGFETFVSATHASSQQVFELFEDWVADHRDLQFFSYLHLFEPHDPCNAPGSLFEKHVREDQRDLEQREVSARVKRSLHDENMETALSDIHYLQGVYRGEIEFLDREMGRLMQYLDREGLSSNTYVVFTSDHGEEFWDHGFYGHGSFLYQESIAVPLIIVGPGIDPGQVLPAPIENRRLYATLLSWLGLEEGWSEDGPPLPPFDLGEDMANVFSSTSKAIVNMSALLSGDAIKGLGQDYSVRRGPWKLVLRRGDGDTAPKAHELFNLERDPAEKQNLIDADGQIPDSEHREIVDDLIQSFGRWWIACERRAVDSPEGEISAETQNALDQIGYLGPRFPERDR